MNKTETNKLNIVSRRVLRTLERIKKEIDNITLARDKLSTFSPEFYLLGQAARSLSEATSHLNIVKNRIKAKLNNESGNT